MIVSAHIFIVLLVPLLLHGNPIHPDDPIHQVIDPWFYENHGQPANANHPHQPLAPRSPSADEPEDDYEYKDFTAQFADLAAGKPCEVPLGSWYRVPSASGKRYFTKGAVFTTQVPTIISTPVPHYLILLSPHIGVTMSDSPNSKIRVPKVIETTKVKVDRKVDYTKKDNKPIWVEVELPAIRVVDISPEEQYSLWDICKWDYHSQSEAISALQVGSKKPRLPEERWIYMPRCFNINIFNVGHEFIEIEVHQTTSGRMHRKNRQ